MKPQRAPVPLIVHIHEDKDAGVFVATSDDVPGLVTEAETLDELKQKIDALVPELLAANGLLDATDPDMPQSVPIELLIKEQITLQTNC